MGNQRIICGFLAINFIDTIDDLHAKSVKRLLTFKINYISIFKTEIIAQKISIFRILTENEDWFLNPIL